MLQRTLLLLLLAAAASHVNCKTFCDANDTCFNVTKVCTAMGRTIIDISSQVHTIPDHCTYQLAAKQGVYEIMAMFKVRHRRDVPFLDSLQITWSSTSLIILLGQGGSVQVDGIVETLNTTSQTHGGVELSMDQYAVKAHIPSVNVTLTFDGTTAHIIDLDTNAVRSGLCGNPADPNTTTTVVAEKSSSISPPQCDMSYSDPSDPTVNCTEATSRCSLLQTDPSFAGCHGTIDPLPYATACSDTLCVYPTVDGFRCHFLQAYAEACRLSNSSLGDTWRSSTTCPSAPTSCLTHYCSNHEFCGDNYGRTRCFCRADFSYKHNNTFGDPTVCTEDSATVSLAVCLLEGSNIDHTKLQLNDNQCKGQLDGQRHMVTFTFNNSQPCGAEVTTDNHQAIFKNTLSTMNSSSTEIIVRHDQVVLNFSCLYDAEKPQSATFKIKDGSVVAEIKSGDHNYTLILNAYSDQSLSTLVGSNTEVYLNQRIWVQLKAEDLDDSQLALVTDSCWATSQASPTSTPRYDLLINGCPNPQDQTVNLVSNGNGMSNTFSFNMFQFAGTNGDVYLHCQMELCTTNGKSCVPTCNGGGSRRRRRSAKDSSLISMVWSN